MTQRDCFLSASNVELWRGDRRVFSDLKLRVDCGERLAVIGPNGSGKSTLLKALHREIYPVDRPGSELKLFGQSRWDVFELRRRIGYVSEELERRYDQNVRVHDTVLSGFFASVGVHGSIARRLSEQQRAAATEWLVRVDLEWAAGRTLKTLSTGERRRCFLARAMVRNPDVLILDEATGGLDFRGRFAFLKSIESLSDVTLLVVSHHLNDLPRTVDRVVLLNDGAIVADGPISSVLTSEMLTSAYRIPISVARVNGRYIADSADE